MNFFVACEYLAKTTLMILSRLVVKPKGPSISKPAAEHLPRLTMNHLNFCVQRV